MTAPEIAFHLGQRLILEEEFSPLGRLLPGMAEVSSALDSVVARPESGNMVVIAMLGLSGHQAEDLQRLGAWLRDAAEATVPRLRGRLVLGLILVHGGELDPRLKQALAQIAHDGLLSKLLIMPAALDASRGSIEMLGKDLPSPGGIWFEEALRQDTTTDPAQVEQALLQRDRERLLMRAWFRPGPLWVTWTLIGVNLVFFLAQRQLAARVDDEMSYLILGANLRELTVGQGEWWRLGTSMFLHFGLLHLSMNMVALYSLGGFLERLLGPARYLALYLGCGLFASAASLLNPVAGLSAGASGAIFAVAGALMALKFKRPANFPESLADRLYRSLSRPIGAILLIGIGWSLVSKMLNIQGIQLDNFAHLGGLSGGILSMILWPAKMREKYNIQA